MFSIGCQSFICCYFFLLILPNTILLFWEAVLAFHFFCLNKFFFCFALLHCVSLNVAFSWYPVIRASALLRIDLNYHSIFFFLFYIVTIFHRTAEKISHFVSQLLLFLILTIPHFPSLPSLKNDAREWMRRRTLTIHHKFIRDARKKKKTICATKNK